MVLVGFWPQYFGPILSGSTDKQTVLHIHAVIFSGWIALFFLQAFHIYRKKVNVHRRWGKYGMYYGVIVILMGLITGIARHEFYLGQGKEPEAINILAVSIRDMLVFSVMFGLAIYYRKKPSIHRVWILGSSAWLLIAAVARANFMVLGGNQFTFFLLWFLPVIAAFFLQTIKQKKFAWMYLLMLGIMYGSSFLDRAIGLLL